MASPRKTASKGSRHDAGEDSATPASTAGRRTCRVCGTAISAYNSGPHCWRHSAGVPWRGPYAKPKFR